MLKSLVVVSGLPRSGTSLMMAALQAGGLPLIGDHSRPADRHNPRGYFEDRRVLSLASEASWLSGQEGKGVKILSHLLPYIPLSVPAKVLFMRRPLPEILASQNAMLGESESPSGMADLMRRDLAQTLAWLEAQEHLDCLEVAFTDLLTQPGTGFAAIAEFLGGSWDLDAMAAVVDPELHRQRATRLQR